MIGRSAIQNPCPNAQGFSDRARSKEAAIQRLQEERGGTTQFDNEGKDRAVTF